MAFTERLGELRWTEHRIGNALTVGLREHAAPGRADSLVCAELEAALRAVRSDDPRATIRQAIADCEQVVASMGRSRPGRAAEPVAQPG